MKKFILFAISLGLVLLTAIIEGTDYDEVG